MLYFKSPDNSVHCIDFDHLHMLPMGSVEISKEDAESISDSIKNTRNIVQEIEDLEKKHLMPRATREFMLIFMESQFPENVLEQNPGYVAVKAFDEQIKALRAQL